VLDDGTRQDAIEVLQDIGYLYLPDRRDDRVVERRLQVFQCRICIRCSAILKTQRQCIGCVQNDTLTPGLRHQFFD
jgi:hypothetical protein